MIMYIVQLVKDSLGNRGVTLLHNMYIYLVLISALSTDESSSLDSLQPLATSERELLRPDT